MDKKLKTALRTAFAAPPPERKTAFLRVHRRRELGSMEMLLTQAGYVRRWTWAGSVALFAAILVLAAGREPETVWTASALTPLLALIAVAEWGRSRRWGMEELELACRMPLRAALLARMAAVGFFHLLLLGLAAPVLALWGGADVLRAGACLLTPYLLTAAVGMELSRRMRGQEGLLACAVAAALVCAVGIWTRETAFDLSRTESASFRWAALALALAASAFELVKTVKETEELQWN